jgi:GntR family transcriptional regulator
MLCKQEVATYMPWELVAGTPVADPANEPWPGGTPAQVASLGHPLTRVEESVKARMPHRKRSGRSVWIQGSLSFRSSDA